MFSARPKALCDTHFRACHVDASAIDTTLAYTCDTHIRLPLQDQKRGRSLR